MKDLNTLLLFFPEMDEKKQESTMGGGYDDPINGGQYGNGFTITAPPIYPGDSSIPYFPYNTPGSYYGPGNPGYGEGGSGQNSYDPLQVAPPALHPESVEHLANVIHYASNLSQTEKDNFKKLLSDIDASPAGDKVILAMENIYNKPNAIIPTVTNTPSNTGTYEYDPNTAQFHMGDLLGGSYTPVWVDYNLSHEIYHNYAQNIGQDSTKSNYEVDAYIFAATIAKDDFESGDALVYERQTEVSQPTTDAQRTYNTAWENLLNGDHSAGNYANIVNNFINGSLVGSNYTTHNGQTVTPDPGKMPDFLK